MKINKIFVGGLLLLAAALSLTLYNLSEQSQAEQAASKVERQLSLQIEQQTVQPTNEVQSESTQESEPHSESEVNAETPPSLPIDGRDYCGILEIPTLAVTLPVQSDLTDSDLKTSPCRYTGWVTSGDMIIAGHNYRRHFGSLAQLDVGDTVRFTTTDNIVYTYTVSGVDEVAGTDIETMLTGDWDLTLFTCTITGTSRVTVRCSQTGTSTEQ